MPLPRQHYPLVRSSMRQCAAYDEDRRHWMMVEQALRRNTDDHECTRNVIMISDHDVNFPRKIPPVDGAICRQRSIGKNFFSHIGWCTCTCTWPFLREQFLDVGVWPLSFVTLSLWQCAACEHIDPSSMPPSVDHPPHLKMKSHAHAVIIRSAVGLGCAMLAEFRTGRKTGHEQ